jgi:HD-GYP domain-containing protein (c-di-GMP phosphodiesterase class II)
MIRREITDLFTNNGCPNFSPIKGIRSDQERIVNEIINLVNESPEVAEELAKIRTNLRWDYPHSLRTAVLFYDLTEQEPELLDAVGTETVIAAGLLHDIGKLWMPKKILYKPGKLKEQEIELIKLHSLYGSMMLRYLEDKYPDISGIVFEHHQDQPFSYVHRSDDPLVLRLGALLCLADQHEALSSSRSYKVAFSQELSKQILNGRFPAMVKETDYLISRYGNEKN